MNSIFSKQIQERVSQETFILTEGEAAVIQHISRVGQPNSPTERADKLIQFFNITEEQACKLLNKISDMTEELIRKNSWSKINKLAIEMYAFVTAHIHGNQYIHANLFSNSLFEEMYGLKFENIFGSPLIY
jgi:hypothetical protein